MKQPLNSEMELLIRQLKQLNEQFSRSFKEDKSFDESKDIYLRIKDANAKLRRFFDTGEMSDLVDQPEGLRKVS